jgi:hypothetical protein
MARQNIEVKVKCYSGYIYAVEPRSFVWEDKELRIKSVKKAWQEPGRRIFRVFTEDGRLFELCYNEQTDVWSAVESML